MRDWWRWPLHSWRRLRRIGYALAGLLLVVWMVNHGGSRVAAPPRTTPPPAATAAAPATAATAAGETPGSSSPATSPTSAVSGTSPAAVPALGLSSACQAFVSAWASHQTADRWRAAVDRYATPAEQTYLEFVDPAAVTPTRVVRVVNATGDRGGGTVTVLTDHGTVACQMEAVAGRMLVADLEQA